MFRGVNIVLQNLVSGLILDHPQVMILHGSGRPTNKIMMIIDKVGEAAAGDLMCYVFTVEDSVLRIYLEDNTQKSTDLSNKKI